MYSLKVTGLTLEEVEAIQSVLRTTGRKITVVKEGVVIDVSEEGSAE